MKPEDVDIYFDGKKCEPCFDVTIEDDTAQVTLPIVLGSAADVALQAQEAKGVVGELLRLHENAALQVTRVRRDVVGGEARWSFWGEWTT